jgi:predicted metal-dependent phosphoesterase TrpH
MTTKFNGTFILFMLFLTGQSFSQRSGTIDMEEVVRIPARREIALPDIPGYLTLKCDFHIHTVFSDGVVWPTVRIDEAWGDGLDAISITDHIEGHPKKLPGQNHQAYEIALAPAKAKNLILVKGGEISRSMPPGHFNALFVKDVNALNLPDYREAMKEAVRQGGFIIWNHPGWRKQQPDSTRWMAEHDSIFHNGWMHGIEVFNEKEWYPEALQWALDRNLAMTGNSDIHDVYDRRYNTGIYPVRPVTLVFAAARTEEAIREAMFARRCAALFFNKLIGPEKWVNPLVERCITVSDPFLRQDGYIFFEVKNNSDIRFTLLREGNDDSGLPLKTILPARSTIVARVKQEAGKPMTYNFILENVLTGVEEYGKYTFTVK